MSDLEASLRSVVGKAEAKKVRKGGFVPAVIYNSNKDSIGISIPTHSISKLLNDYTIKTKVLDISVEGKIYKTVIKDVSFHPVTDSVLHIDFMVVQDNAKLEVSIPIEIINQDKSVVLKRGGQIVVISYNLPLLCNTSSIPSSIVIDVSLLKMGKTLKISDLSLPNGVTFKKDLNILKVTGKSSAKEEEPEQLAAAASASEPAKAEEKATPKKK